MYNMIIGFICLNCDRFKKVHDRKETIVKVICTFIFIVSYLIVLYYSSTPVHALIRARIRSMSRLKTLR